MVLTQEHDTTNYWASWEALYRPTESKLFGNIASTCVAWTSMPNYQNIPNNLRFGVWSPNDSVSKVDYNGTTGQTTGVNLLLKVMAGDTVMPGVQCYYASNTITTTNSSFSTVLNSLVAGIMGTPTGGAEGTLSGYTSSGSPVYSGLTSFLSTKDPAPPSGYPKAYLNWILLDDQFNYVSSASGSIAVASSTYPANQFNTIAAGGPIVMPRNGYLYVWVSNETQGWDVFFDNFTVQYKQGPVLEENHYYPFGLTMAGISDKAVKMSYAENKYRYNGKEFQHQEFSDGTGLEEYDFGARMYDAQLGRWAIIDPLSKNFAEESPYNYVGNDPENKYDVRGSFKFPAKDEAYIKEHYPHFYNYIKTGVQNLLKSDRIVQAFGKYGLMDRHTLEKEFAFNSGAELIVHDMGGQSKGRTQREKPEHNIELDYRLLDLVEKAAAEDKDAALLFAVMTLLHEEAHRGSLADHMDNPNRTTGSEDGDALATEIYGELAPNLEYGTDFMQKEWQKSVIRDANAVINDKKGKNQSEDLPTMSWDDAIKWVGNALAANPSITLTVTLYNTSQQK